MRFPDRAVSDESGDVGRREQLHVGLLRQRIDCTQHLPQSLTLRLDGPSVCFDAG
jgi:hypothetical protein